jgi:hypothetical protein
MALVDYSDSDDSAVEDTLAVNPATKATRGTFQKVVDRANPGKIRVSLPKATLKQEEKQDEPPAKRMKTGGGMLSDFKSFLPPPKRTGQASSGALGGGNVVRKTGLAPGFMLRTGAEPGFSRDVEIPTESVDLDVITSNGDDEKAYSAGASPPRSTSKIESQRPAEEVKLVGKPLMFKPLSVTRNPAKKKKKQAEISTTTSVTSGSTPISTTTTSVEQPILKQKVSLFSVAIEPDEPMVSMSKGDYQPMIYGTGGDKSPDTGPPITRTDISLEGYNGAIHSSSLESLPPPSGPQSLDEIAADMNLSTAERRQLFGRQKGNRSGAMPSATKIINFNTDEEYRHNEELRAAGEQVVHNPVRAIAPGKHSLKQLVNAAQSQKEALEESFAKGKSNRAEASSRYGW